MNRREQIIEILKGHIVQVEPKGTGKTFPYISADDMDIDWLAGIIEGRIADHLTEPQVSEDVKALLHQFGSAFSLLTEACGDFNQITPAGEPAMDVVNRMLDEWAAKFTHHPHLGHPGFEHLPNDVQESGETTNHTVTKPQVSEGKIQDIVIAEFDANSVSYRSATVLQSEVFERIAENISENVFELLQPHPQISKQKTVNSDCSPLFEISEERIESVWYDLRESIVDNNGSLELSDFKAAIKKLTKPEK